MAKNTGKEHRQGAVKERSQTFNPKTNCFVKRDTKTGKFVSCKKDEPFKGVTKEKIQETTDQGKSDEDKSKD